MGRDLPIRRSFSKLIFSSVAGSILVCIKRRSQAVSARGSEVSARGAGT